MRRALAVLFSAAAALTLAPLHAADAASPIQIRSVRYDSPGSDTGSNTSLNAEYVLLQNVTNVTRNLKGWRVQDAAGHTYTFTTTTYLKAGQSLAIHTGRGANSATHRYWGRTWYVWNNTGDRAVLRTPTGGAADSCAWTRVGTGSVAC